MMSDAPASALPPELAQLPEILALMSDRLALVEARLAHLYSMSAAVQARQTVALDDGFIGVRTPTGWVVVGQEEFRTVLYLSDGQFGHEPGTSEVLRRLIRPGDHVADVGAHIGLLTIVMADAVGSNGHVHAFEPVARSAESTRRSLVANGFAERCSIHVVAVAGEAGQARFYRGYNSMMGSLYDLGQSDDFTMVDIRSLDQSIEATLPLSLVKIDVEGAEIDVLAGMRRLIADNDQLVVIAEFGPAHLERISVSIDAWLLGFTDQGLTEILMIDEQARTVRPYDRAALDQVTSVNLLFSKPQNPRLEVLPGYVDHAPSPATNPAVQSSN